uniref:Putative secreted protein n=1 Tax=Ixodes ricinus TaxID=34613 RepID=A0A6B0U548_IXORI
MRAAGRSLRFSASSASFLLLTMLRRCTCCESVGHSKEVLCCSHPVGPLLFFFFNVPHLNPFLHLFLPPPPPPFQFLN